MSLYFSGPSLSAVTTSYEQLVANEQALARDGEISSAHVVLEVINVDGVTASIRNCHIDAAMTVVAASPDDIVNGDVVRYTSLNDILLVEGTWRLTMAKHSPRRSGGRHPIDSR